MLLKINTLEELSYFEKELRPIVMDMRQAFFEELDPKLIDALNERGLSKNDILGDFNVHEIGFSRWLHEKGGSKGLDDETRRIYSNIVREYIENNIPELKPLL